MTKKEITNSIKNAINRLAIINSENMTVNEFLFALSRSDIKEPFVNLTNETTNEFTFGFADGFWPNRHRALKVKHYGVWVDKDSGSIAIDIKAVEA